MEKVKMQKFSLKPIEAELQKIRKGLEEESEFASPKKKKILLGEIKKLDKLIALVPNTCKHHTLG